jgi:hypothetical protein
MFFRGVETTNQIVNCVTSVVIVAIVGFKNMVVETTNAGLTKTQKRRWTVGEPYHTL